MHIFHGNTSSTSYMKKYFLHLIFTFYLNTDASVIKKFPCRCISIKNGDHPWGRCWPIYLELNIGLARNGNSGCANEILGCAKCQFWWKSPWKWKNWGNFRVCNWLNCLCKTQVHGWLAKTMESKPSLNCWIAVERAEITFILIHINANQNSYHDDKSML